MGKQQSSFEATAYLLVHLSNDVALMILCKQHIVF